MNFKARRQEITQTLRALGDRARTDSEYYGALSDYVERFQAIRNEVTAMAQGSQDSNAIRRHKEVEDRIYKRRDASPQYRAARDILEAGTQRLHQLDSEEFAPIADQRDIAPGILIFGDIYETLATIKREVDTQRR